MLTTSLRASGPSYTAPTARPAEVDGLTGEAQESVVEVLCALVEEVATMEAATMEAATLEEVAIPVVEAVAAPTPGDEVTLAGVPVAEAAVAVVVATMVVEAATMVEVATTAEGDVAMEKSVEATGPFMEVNDSALVVSSVPLARELFWPFKLLEWI